MTFSVFVVAHYSRNALEKHTKNAPGEQAGAISLGSIAPGIQKPELRIQNFNA
jgi:hypothetical protein